MVRHEYRKVVLKWSFLIGTLLLPFLAACFAVVPALIFSLKGEPTRIVVVDPTEKIAPRLFSNLSADKMAERARQAASDSMTDFDTTQEEKIKRTSSQFGESFVFVQYDAREKSTDQIRRELLGKVAENSIDGYLLIPENADSPDAVFE